MKNKRYISWKEAETRKLLGGVPIAPDNVKVYYNLNLKCLSVIDMDTGRLYCHGNYIEITNASFKVQQSGRRRVLRENKKNVHAYIKGKFHDHSDDSVDPGDFPPRWSVSDRTGRATYDPYRHKHFMDMDNGEKIHGSPRVIITVLRDHYRGKYPQIYYERSDKYLFVGEERSDKAKEMGVTWEDGALAAKQLFDALDYSGVDMADCEFTNLFEKGGRAKVRNWGGRVVGMGNKVQGELDNMSIPYIPLVHPAARGSIRKKETYCKHVKERLAND